MVKRYDPLQDEAVATIQEALTLAVGQHQAGRFAEAEQIYRQILEIDPNHSDARNLLGLIAHRSGRSDLAIEYIRQAIGLNPGYEGYHLNLGAVYQDTGQHVEAMACFREALRLKPDWATAYYNLATVLLSSGRVAEAEDNCRQAIRLQPNYAEAYNNLGITLQTQGNLLEAQAQFEQALRLKPDFVNAYANLGNLLRLTGRRTEAIQACQLAVRLDPNSLSANSSLGAALFDDLQLDAAIASFREAVRINGAHAESLANLGAALGHRRQIDEAIYYSTEALRLQPDYPMAHWNRAIHWLATGNFEQGWPEMEWRLEFMAERLKREFPQKRWTGGDPSGQTILLHSEGGFGDGLQLVRYAPLVQQRGGRVILECPSELKSLFQSVAGVTQVVARATEPLPTFDVQCPLASLPLAFGTTLPTIPASIPYLVVDPQRIAAFRDRVMTDKTALRVGLVWSGSAKDTRVNNPNCTLEHFSPLADVKNVVFYSLQKGPAAEEARSPPRGMNLVDLTAELTDFADTGALIANLDLVISVDTSVVHLAGALGYPAWVVLAYVPDFRWLLDRDDSPWYPTLRLFRQPALGDWTIVFQRVRRTWRGWRRPSVPRIQPRTC